MPTPSWLKACWQSTQFCGKCLVGLVRWLSWIALALLAGLQIYILSVRELAVPEFVLRNVETRMATAGLHAKFGDLTLDPTGKLLLQDARLSLLSSDTTVMRARSISLQVDPIALWLKRIEPREIRFNDLDLLIPPTRSPTGEAEPWLKGVNTALLLGEKEGMVHLPYFTAKMADIAISAHGKIALPVAKNDEALPFDHMVRQFAQNYLKYCETAGDIMPQLPTMRDAKVELTLTPHSGRGATISPRLKATYLELPIAVLKSEPLALEDVSVEFEFGDTLSPAGPIELLASSLKAPGVGELDNLHAQVGVIRDAATGQFRADQVALTGSNLVVRGNRIEAITGRFGLAGVPIVQADATLHAAGSAWSLSTDLDVTSGAGKVKLAGEVDMELLRLVTEQINFDVPSILSWEDRPVLAVQALLGPGAKPLRAEADFSTGKVTARWVPLDATSARVTWRENQLRADQILLRTHESEAFGSYEMDTDTNAFRFLLEGRLNPPRINGWFRDWWPRFFSTFEFPGGPPEASVEVSGQWGLPLDTIVFISAEAHNAVVKEIALERMRTRMFIRPGWADVTHFLAEREPGDVEGSFSRSWRLPDGRRWTSLTIDARGRSDISPVPKLMPASGEAIIEPFSFSGPVDMLLQGSISREDIGSPVTEDFRIQGATTGDWKFKGFALENLSFNVHRTNDIVLVENFQTLLGGGELTGRAELRGPAGGDKRLAFDVNLEEAEMGQTLHDVLTWTAARRGETKAQTSDFEKLMQAGKLTLSLTAEGPSDDAMALQGAGSAAITHPNLANINLLGPLSTLLSSTILNFSTLQLNQANADFTLNGPKLVFPSVKITGERGAMDASGSYSFATKQLDFNNRVRPFEGGEGLLDAVFTPFSSALEVKLRGGLTEPKWTFVYGPTNILRNLTGENTRSSPASPPANSENSNSPPPVSTPETISSDELNE